MISSRLISPPLLLAILLVMAPFSIALSVTQGSVALPFNDVLAAFFGDVQNIQRDIVIELRLPRALTAWIVGGLLALSGVLMQVLIRNPLADPYILGVSGGAATGALLVMSLGLFSATTMAIAAGSVAGSLISMSLVLGLSWRRGLSPDRLLLTGVVLSAGWGAAIAFMLAISEGADLRGMMFWLMGDLDQARPALMPALGLLAALVLCLLNARHLNLLSHGPKLAASMGTHVPRLRLFLFFLASLLAAGAVMQAGAIGFVGLVVPHLIRLLTGVDHRFLLPASVLLGGTLTTFADLLARTVVAPEQLPVGVLMAFLGVPMFLLVMRRAP